MAREVTIPIIIALGAGITVYALTVQKEEPRTAATILSLIGAAAGLLSISSAISAKMSAQQALKLGSQFGNVVNTITKIGCPAC